MAGSFAHAIERRRWGTLVLPALAAWGVAAQWNVARFDGARNQVYTTFGLDPAFVGSVGYARVVPLFGLRWQLSAEGELATFELDRRDYRARVQVRTSIVHWRSLHFVGSAAFITRGTENSIYRALDFGSDFTGAAGVYRPGWFVAGEFGFDKAVITHITHSDWYRTYFYPDAKDGWYLNAGGTFHYGATAGVAIGPAELVGRAGWLQTEDFNDLTPPMYVSLGLGSASSPSGTGAAPPPRGVGPRPTRRRRQRAGFSCPQRGVTVASVS